MSVASPSRNLRETAVPRAPGEPRPPFTPTQEMRFAVVMYGGVSLAIYINGVVQELLRLVRATAPATPPTDESYPAATLLSSSELEGSERVYRELGQLLEWRSRPGAEPRSEAPQSADPILTRFVVDIISGSSAGGINGIFLAKALANDVPMGQLRKLWLDEGDMSVLINDGRSYAGLGGLARQDPPHSALNSRRLYWKLLEALDEMDGSQRPDGPGNTSLVDELDLWITATDVRGLTKPIDLYDRVVWEKRYRNVFHFVYSNPWASGGGEPRNDLARAINPFLAFSGRCTSSFPFAFEPMALEDIDEVVANPKFRATYGGSDSQQAEWARFFRDYALGRDDDHWYRHRAFGDGGYLDNKPFTWSTDNLQRRHADRPVDRKLIYIEPDPGTVHALRREPGAALPEPAPLAQQVAGDRPDPLQNIEAAILTLPRAETIREDLDRLLERNRQIMRLARITAIAESVVGLSWRQLDTAAWLPLGATELARERGAQYLAYYRLKLATVLDSLAETVTLLAGFDADSDERSAIRCFIQAWFEERYDEGREQNQFLLDLDLGYRLRRLNFLQDRIDELLRGDERAVQILERDEDHPAVAAPDGELRRMLLDLKGALNTIFVRLRKTGRDLRTRGPNNPIWERLPSLPIDRTELLSVLSGAHDEEESVAGAGRKLRKQPALGEGITAIGDALAERLAAVFQSPEMDVRSVIAARSEDGDATAGRAVQELLRYYDHYEEFDAITLPIAYGQIGESDRVEVIRVSPEDATSIRDEVATKERKLGGIELNHFGGFFRRDWRQNDFLWGRLDGAERILVALLRPGEVTEELRADLLRRAQRAIVIEELELTGDDAERRADELLERLRTQDVDRAISPNVMVDLVGRTTAVTGRLLHGIERRRGVVSVGRVVIDAGSLGAGVVEVATARTRKAWAWRIGIIALLLASIGVLVWAAASDREWLIGLSSAALVAALAAAAVVIAARLMVGRLGRPKPGP